VPWQKVASLLVPNSSSEEQHAVNRSKDLNDWQELTLVYCAGKLLTTPSRLLKLILPLTTLDKNEDRKSIEPLALLVHPQQPLSYLERLIQSELPMIKSKDGKDKVPEVYFRAEDSAQDEIKADTRDDTEVEEEEGSDEQMVDGKLIKLGKISSKSDEEEESLKEKQERIESGLRGGPGEGGVETYSGAGREASSSEDGERNFVRWSSSTEIGDFIRDAARGKEFAVEIEGASKEIRVGVPSFNDRTHYLRIRFRKTNKKLAQYAMIKKECDGLAHRSAQRIAMGGFGILVTWWFAIVSPPPELLFREQVVWRAARHCYLLNMPVAIESNQILLNLSCRSSADSEIFRSIILLSGQVMGGIQWSLSP
jgi:hypothetical protein